MCVCVGECVGELWVCVCVCVGECVFCVCELCVGEGELWVGGWVGGSSVSVWVSCV